MSKRPTLYSLFLGFKACEIKPQLVRAGKVHGVSRAFTGGSSGDRAACSVPTRCLTVLLHLPHPSLHVLPRPPQPQPGPRSPTTVQPQPLSPGHLARPRCSMRSSAMFCFQISKHLLFHKLRMSQNMQVYKCTNKSNCMYTKTAILLRSLSNKT